MEALWRDARSRWDGTVHALRDGWRARRIHARKRSAVAAAADFIVAGPLASPTGIGKGARLMARELRAQGHRVETVDVSRLLGLPATEPEFAAGLRELPEADEMILHLNPPRFLEIYTALGAVAARCARVSAYWSWELERVPRWWRHAARSADRILVPSPFVRDAVIAGLGAECPPVEIAPHPVQRDEPVPRDEATRRRARARLGLAPGTFVAGFSFSMLSGFRRKNPLGAVRAFRAAFGEGEDCALLLRCPDAERGGAAWAELRDAVACDARIRLVDAAVTPCAIGDFYAAIDAYLSLHRSEGYGLTLAEALGAGIPTVATAWGLAPELAAQKKLHPVPSALVPVSDPGGPYAAIRALRWAEPEVADAAAHLRALKSGLR